MLDKDGFLSLVLNNSPDSQYKSQPGGYGFKETGLAFPLFYTWSNQHLLRANHVPGIVPGTRKYKDEKDMAFDLKKNSVYYSQRLRTLR